MNPFQFWQIIKDDSKRTFEACSRTANTNAFTNQVYAMQRAGMLVSCVTPPVTNKNASKELVSVTGYSREEGLYDRLMKQYRDLSRPNYDEIEAASED